MQHKLIQYTGQAKTAIRRNLVPHAALSMPLETKKNPCDSIASQKAV